MALTQNRKVWLGGSVVAIGLLGLLLGPRGCSGPTVPAVAAQNDRRPDPKQPLPNMNAAGCFVNTAGHAKPQLQIPARADAATATSAVTHYVNQIITAETRQLSSAAAIQQHTPGAISAGVAAYNTAVAVGASPAMANQAAMVSAAQFLHNQGVMGPLICPTALGFDMGHSAPMVQ